MVESVRMGYGFLHDQNAWSRWRAQIAARRATTHASKSLNARSLETHVMHTAISAPRLVALPGQEPRRMRAADVRAKILRETEERREKRAAAAERRAARLAARKGKS